MTAAGDSLGAAVLAAAGGPGGLTFTGRGGRSHLAPGDLRDRACEVADGFDRAGVEPGDRVVLLPNEHEELVVSFLGALVAGVVAVPFAPPTLGQAAAHRSRIARVAAVSGARCVVASASTCRLLGPALGQLEWLRLDELERGGGRGVRPHAGGEVAYLQFTSGSTAAPKGVPVTHAGARANIGAIGRHLDLRAGTDRAVSWLPMYHDMGLVGFLLTPLLHGVPVWYLSLRSFARRPTSWCALLSEVGGTISFAPTSAYASVLARATDEEVGCWDLASWRVAGCGAEPIAPGVLDRFAERLAPTGFRRSALMPSYGLAEAVLAVTMHDREAPPRTVVARRDRLRAGEVVDVGTGAGAGVEADADAGAVEIVGCGAPIGDLAVRVVDGAGAPLPEDREGRVQVRGASVIGRWWHDDDAPGPLVDGWLETGDLGFLRDGELFVTGRTKNVVIVAGRNHHLEDVEAACAGLDGIRRGNLAALPLTGAGPGGPGDDPAAEGIGVLFEPARGSDEAEVAGRIRDVVRSVTGGVACAVAAAPGSVFARTSSGKLRRDVVAAEGRARLADREVAGPGLRPLVLHALRIKGVAEVPDIAAYAGADAGAVAEVLEALRREQLAVPGEGPAVWRLTPAGRAQLPTGGDPGLDDTARAVVEEAYDGFLALNERFKQVCTDWQLRPARRGGALEVNDHLDRAYDAKVVARLGAVHRSVAPVAECLGRAARRFASYEGRLASALRRVEQGDRTGFVGPLTGSYHDVWAELHADLLATLGRERGPRDGH